MIDLVSKLRWKGIKEDTPSQPLASTFICTHPHSHRTLEHMDILSANPWSTADQRTPQEVMAFLHQSELGDDCGDSCFTCPSDQLFREITGERVALCCSRRAEKMHISRSVASPSLISQADLSTPRQPSLPPSGTVPTQQQPRCHRQELF